MKPLRLPQALQPYFQQELAQYQAVLRQHRLRQAWLHLERAHILGQAYPLAHTRVHWLMLRYGWRTRNLAEVWGQLIRLVLGFIGSLAGKIPVGNTGGSNVPLLQPMPIPADLQQVLTKVN